MTLATMAMLLALGMQSQSHPTETMDQLETRIQRANPAWSAAKVERAANTIADICMDGNHELEISRIAELTRATTQCSGKTKAGKQCQRRQRAATCFQHRGAK